MSRADRIARALAAGLGIPARGIDVMLHGQRAPHGATVFLFASLALLPTERVTGLVDALTGLFGSGWVVNTLRPLHTIPGGQRADLSSWDAWTVLLCPHDHL